MIKAIAGEHTIYKIPPVGGKILDVGCRSYSFANYMAKQGCEIWAVEPDNSVKESENEKIHLIRTALVAPSQRRISQTLLKWSTGEGNRLISIGAHTPVIHTKQKTSCHTILEINEMVGVEVWDIIKFDCEGAEYDILLEWPGPISKQITVEFHDFFGVNFGKQKMYDKIFKHIEQWYTIIQHEETARLGQKTRNHWDSLFILKKEL